MNLFPKRGLNKLVKTFDESAIKSAKVLNAELVDKNLVKIRGRFILFKQRKRVTAQSETNIDRKKKKQNKKGQWKP